MAGLDEEAKRKIAKRKVDACKQAAADQLSQDGSLKKTKKEGRSTTSSAKAGRSRQFLTS